MRPAGSGVPFGAVGKRSVSQCRATRENDCARYRKTQPLNCLANKVASLVDIFIRTSPKTKPRDYVDRECAHMLVIA
jgi:hypothetical protein